MVNSSITSPYIANPTLWSSYRHEIFKGRRQAFYRILLFVPFLITILLCVVQTIIKLTSNQPQVLRDGMFNIPGYDLGSVGTFAYANGLLFTYSLLYNILTVGGCSLLIANEYRWNTIKMLASRQPSRANLVLSKCLAVLTLVGGVALAFVISWFGYGLFLKYFYNLPFELNSDDLANMGKGLGFYAISTLQVLILALAAVALTFLFKSVIAGFLVYIIYNGLDSVLSAISSNVVNTGHAGTTGFMGILLDMAGAINPFLIGSNINRLTMQTQRQQFFYDGSKMVAHNVPNTQAVFTMPEWWSWAVLLLYVAGFTVLSIWIFRHRDITD